MDLGQTIQTYNPTQALKREKTGTFLVVTPGGEEIYITCRPGDSVANIEWADPANRKPFLVSKIAEPVNVMGAHRPLEAVG